MNILELSPSALSPYAKNTKKHDKKQIQNVALSIQKYGFVQPIVVDRNNVVVIGHCRLMAAKKLGLATVPCVKAEELSDDQINELRIIDNKTNESAWDNENLMEELKTLDFEGFDFDFGIDVKEKKEVVEVPVPDDEDVEPVVKRGEIWKLGDHVLMCGDSTSLEDAAKLTSGHYVDCVCTDPPYNMAYEGAGRTPAEKRKKNKILNDSMPEEEFEVFMHNVYAAMASVMKEGASCYVFYKEMGRGTFIKQMFESPLTYKQELIWVKNQLVLGGADYQSMYEPCLYGCKGKREKWFGKRNKHNVIESIDLMTIDELREAVRALTEDSPCDVIREKKTAVNDLHPTMKPIKRLAHLLENSTLTGDAVLDLFGGSGSTLLACEQMNRKCYMMELDTHYCDVIIKRWEDFTGRKAERIECQN